LKIGLNARNPRRERSLIALLLPERLPGAHLNVGDFGNLGISGNFAGIS
jgi:hypothetical protein